MYAAWKISVLYLRVFVFEWLCFLFSPRYASAAPLRVPAGCAPCTQRGRPAAAAGAGQHSTGTTSDTALGWAPRSRAALPLTGAGGFHVCSSLYHAQRGMEAEPTVTPNSVQR